MPASMAESTEVAPFPIAGLQGVLKRVKLSLGRVDSYRQSTDETENNMRTVRWNVSRFVRRVHCELMELSVFRIRDIRFRRSDFNTPQSSKPQFARTVRVVGCESTGRG